MWWIETCDKQKQTFSRASYRQSRFIMYCIFPLVSRIVERGYYSERDAAHVIKQILEAVAVRLLPSLSHLTVRLSGCRHTAATSLLTAVTVTLDNPAAAFSLLVRLLVTSCVSVQSLQLHTFTLETSCSLTVFSRSCSYI